MWVWISMMNPHRLAWGFAYNFPFGQVIAIATLVGVVLSKEKIRFPWSAPVVFLLLLVVWMNITTIFAINFDLTVVQWQRVMKIQLMTFLAFALVYRRDQIKWLVWLLVISVGFFGVKGGVFTFLGGGENRVYGPAESFIADNNAMSLALVMIIPLMRYLQIHTANKWARYGLFVAMALSAVSVLGSHSRGAFLALGAMIFFLWLKSSKKFAVGIVLLALTPIALGLMPQKWTSRMESIENYEQDLSVQGRFNAWWMTFNLAKDRPIVGGGFEIYEPNVYQRYAPDPTDIHSAHSLYFQMLGEHGFVGLLLFLLLWISTWRVGNNIIRMSARNKDYIWAGDLSRAIQVSLVGYAVGGTFVNMGYFDLPYYEIVLLIATYMLLKKELMGPTVTARSSKEPSLNPSLAVRRLDNGVSERLGG
ncbi:MAG: putative O-glycosylation ligase, exosortase A system-associated [Burkholderiales bacterium]|nr:putative O-glycosylation ligase, exosortase A system-associated [Burkholderiales bacterium]